MILWSITKVRTIIFEVLLFGVPHLQYMDMPSKCQVAGLLALDHCFEQVPTGEISQMTDPSFSLLAIRP